MIILRRNATFIARAYVHSYSTASSFSHMDMKKHESCNEDTLRQLEEKVGKDRIEKLRSLDVWLKQNGGNDYLSTFTFCLGNPIKNKVDWAWFRDAGVGVAATDDVEAFETLLMVPLNLCINYGVACELFGRYLNFPPSASKDDKAILVYLFLIHHKFHNTTDSFWGPYMDVLPESYDTPLYWSADEMQYLSGSPMFDYAMRTREKLRHKYQQFVVPLTQKHPEVFPAHIYTYANFLWGFSSLWTRCFGLATHEKDTLKASMVPLADMFNHSSITKHSILTDEDRFRFKTHQPYKKGDQVFNNYGRKNNSVLLFHYGFVVEGNTFKNGRPFKVTMGLNAFDADMDRKMELLLKKELDMHFEVGADPELLQRVLGIMRVCVMNSFEMYFYDENSPLDMVIDLRNESAAFAKLRELLVSLRSALPNSVAEDRELLMSKFLSYRNRCALVYRIELKEVLEQAMKNVTEMEFAFLNSSQWRPLRNLYEIPKRNSNLDLVEEHFLTQHRRRLRLPEFIEMRKEIDPARKEETRFYFYTMKPFEELEFDSNGSFPLIRMDENDMILSSDNARLEFSAKFPLADLYPQLISDVELLLILFIIYKKHKILRTTDEQGKGSPGVPNAESVLRNFFSCSVPRVFSTPLYYTEEELTLLKGLPIYDDVVERKAQLRKTFDSIVPTLCKNHPDVFDASVFAFEEFLWSYTLVQACGVPMIVQRKVKMAVVPLYRYFVYHPHHQITRNFDNETRQFEIRYPIPPNLLPNHSKSMSNSSSSSSGGKQRTPTSTPRGGNQQTTQRANPNSSSENAGGVNSSRNNSGVPLLDNYGALNNYHLLMRHGFLNKENPYDTVSFSLNISAESIADDPLAKQKLEILRNENLTFQHELRRESVSQRLLNTIRICLMNEDELKSYGKKTKSKQKVRFDYSAAIVSTRNEKATLETLQQIVQSMLDSIEQNAGGSAWDDRDLLASNKLTTQNARDAVLYRMLQKEILQRALRNVSDLKNNLEIDS